MKLQFYPEEKLKKEILAIIGKYLDLKQYKVFFFGSRVSGKGDERSDIDIGIKGKEAVPPLSLSDIQEDLENLPTLYKLDIVDFAQVDERFKKVALQCVEPLNETRKLHDKV